jgi:ArsR family transcriptional regulator
MSPADYLTTLAEPTRLRLLSCLAAAPLFVSDLQAVLNLPQSTVSRHLKVLRDLGLAEDRRMASHVVYRLALPAGACGRMVRAVLDALRADPAFKAESAAARARTRALVEDSTLMAVHGV